MRPRKDLTGQRFGRLVAKRVVGRAKYGLVWECDCDCGKTHKTITVYLLSGDTKSCGCLYKEMLETGHPTHGLANKHPDYYVWKNMRSRCNNPNNQDYRHYGGRGITICKRWDSFLNFIEDMGPRLQPKLSIERKDVNGNYEPSNCIWATQTEQMRNIRPYDRKGRNLVIPFATVQAIRIGKSEGVKATELATRYGLSEGYVHQIVRGTVRVSA